MATIIDNNQLIAAPPVGLLRYGLFSAAGAILPMDTRIIASGLSFFADHCGDGATYDQTCTVNPVKPFNEGSDLMEADPFWVLARKRCGAVGRTGEEMLAAVRQLLGTREQQLVEEVVWDGGALTTATPTLTGSGATIVVPGAAGAGAAIAALEEAFYDTYGYVGTIHVNTQAYAAAAYSELVERSNGGVLTTPLGSVWSFGSGYGITGPADVAPAAGFVWAFMTGKTTIWRTEILPQPDPRQTLDRSLNQWDVVAERVYAVTWDCPEVVAVQVPIAAPAVATAPAVPA
jgi:hypothetical protein